MIAAMASTRTQGLIIALGCVALLGVVVASRLVYAPPYLFGFDSANFAFAIDRFDPRQHQPQPPGYPLFVALLKVLNGLVRSANHALILSGIIGTVAGVVLTWMWAAEMFGNRAGWLAAVILAVHPVFWVAGIVNPVRTFLVVIAAATAVLSWRAMTAADPRVWFYATSGALGLLAGFRPETLVLLFPLWVAAGWFRRLSIRAWLIGAGILAASALVWIAPLVIRMGGARSTFTIFFEYLRFNSQAYTMAFGASSSASAATIRRVLIWNFGLTVAWIWAVPFALGRLRTKWTRVQSLSLTCSFVPAFLFHALIHVRDIDQTLITIPVLCVLGGAVLSNVRTSALMPVAAVIAILVTAWNFRRPMLPEMAAASRAPMRFINDWNRSTFAALDSLSMSSNSVLVWDGAVVSWRQVSYYYPNRRLLVLEPNHPVWIISNRDRSANSENGIVFVPDAKMLVLGVSYLQTQSLERLPHAQRRGPLVLLPWGPGGEVKVGHFVLRRPL